MAVFYITAGDATSVWVFPKFIEMLIGSEVTSEFRERLTGIFPDRVKPDAKEVGIPLDTLGPKLREFEELLLWLFSKLSDE